MTTEEFIKEYTKDEDKQLLLSSIMKTKYVPVEEKSLLMSRLIESTSHTNISDKKLFKQDSFSRLLLFELILINEYTDIDISFKNVISEYNLLSKELLVDKIISLIPNSEKAMFATIRDCKVSDLEANERSILSFLDIKFEVAKTLFSNLKSGFDKYIQSEEGQKLVQMAQERLKTTVG